jgi:PKD repeat protein
MKPHTKSIRTGTFLAFFLLTFSVFSQSNFSLCQGISFTNATSGTFYDSGGPNNFYQNNETCFLVIDPGCAESITITVWEYSTEPCCDGLRFYDGPNANSPLILDMQFLNAPQVVTAYSGKVYVRWSSDYSVTAPGFRVDWISQVIAADPPVADFTVSDNQPALGEEVNFSAISSSAPYEWQWDFGDGGASALQNPVHAYQTPGTYTVQLIATNCVGLSDTVEQTIVVQEAPALAFSPTDLQISLPCGTTTQTTITLNNNGQGDLLYQLNANGSGTQTRVLIFNYNAFYYSVDGLLNAMSAYPDDYYIEFIGSLEPVAFAAQLNQQDVLIFPDMPPSAETDFILQTLRDIILDFVGNGGSIVFCGQEYGGSVLPFSGLWQSDYNTYYASNQQLVLQQPHPITDGLPSPLFAPFASMAINFTNPDFVSLSSINGNSWIGYRQIGASQLVYLGMNFYNYGPEHIQLLNNTLHWCGSNSGVTFSPQSGEIAPGSSQEITVTFSAESLLSGIYNGVIQITGNDPANPTAGINYTLDVSGTPGLSLTEPLLDFGAWMQFATATSTVPVTNTGCDTLFVQQISSTHPAFTTNAQQIIVPPFSTVYLEVAFMPQDTGFQSAFLIFDTNAGVDSTSLQGYGLGAPVTAINPQSLSLSLDCGETATLPLNISNSGLGELQMQSQIGENASYQILIIQDASIDPYYANRVGQAILTRFPQADITWFDGNDPSLLPSLLPGKHLVVMPFIGAQPESHYTQIGQFLQPYLEGGGGLICTGTYFVGNLNALGFMSGTGDLINGYGYPMNPAIPQHPLLEGVDVVQPFYNDFYGLVFNSPGTEIVATVNGQSYVVLSTQSVGNGKVVYFGSSCASHYDNDLDVLENAVNYAASPTWVSVQPDQLTVPAGENATINVVIDANNLVANTYQQTIEFTTNDPQNPLIAIPVTLVVEGDPALENLPAQLSFGVVQQFSQKELTLDFENTGCATLQISGASIDHPDFQVLNFSAQVLPYQQGMISIRFSPQIPGNIGGNLTLTTNAGIFVIPIGGVAVAAPVAGFSPGAINVELRCDETQSITLQLNNTGEGPLNYQVGNLQSPRNVLGLLYGVDGSRWENIRNYFQQQVPNIQLTDFNGTSAAELSNAIAQHNIEVIVAPPFYFSSGQAYTNFKPVLQSFLQNGGQVLVLGQYYTGPAEQMGLYDLYDLNVVTDYPVKVIEPQHPLCKNLTSEYQAFGEMSFATFPFGDVQPLIRRAFDNFVYLGLKTVGRGNIIYWAPTLYWINNSATPELHNIFAWMSNPLSPAMEMAVTGGVVTPGGSIGLQIDFDGTGVPAGQQTGYIHLYTNDPVNNPVLVPYTLTMSAHPCADFIYETPPCSGTIGFNDNTLNGATSWYWDFGDGGTSFAQNPGHTYAAEGAWPVTFIACNALGCDTLIRTVEIFSIDGPMLPSCTPPTLSSCCDFGFKRVNVGFLDHVSGDAATEGYEDFSCTYGTELMAGMQFLATVETSWQLPEDVRAWIDLNNNGVFTNNELILSGVSNPTLSGYFTVPINAVRDVPLRMRVLSEYAGTNPALTACSDLYWGQVEDYYVIIRTTVGAGEPAATLSSRIYPNPSAGGAWLEFSLPQRQSADLRITDAVGRVIWEETLPDADAGDQRWLLPDLPAGQYAVCIRSGAAMNVQKWVVTGRP